MNCAKHPEVSVAAYCRTCGKALCESCRREVRGVIYCEDCLASRVQAPPPPRPTPRPPGSGPHPAVSGVLAGCLPFGVGQAYNGQYARGLVYLVLFVGLIWAVNQGGGAEPVFGILIAALYFWQLIDAVRSASYLQAGLPAPDPFGLDRLFGGGAVPQNSGSAPSSYASPSASSSALVPLEPDSASGAPPPANSPAETTSQAHVPAGALFLIGIGALLLLGNIGLFQLHRVVEFWPMILVAIGGWMLADRWTIISMGGQRGRHLLMGPAVLLVLGFSFQAHSLGWMGFGQSWPLLLIAIGAVLLWQRSAQSSVPPSSPAPFHETSIPDSSLERRGEDHSL